MLFRLKWKRKRLRVSSLFKFLFVEATAFKRIPRLVYHHIHGYTDIKSTIESLTVGENSCNGPSVTTLSITKYSKLKTIDICSSSFSYVNRVTVENCPLLVSINIGRLCFSTEESQNSLFCVKGCPIVKKVCIHYGTFVRLNEFIMQSIVDFPWLFRLTFVAFSTSLCSSIWDS